MNIPFKREIVYPVSNSHIGNNSNGQNKIKPNLNYKPASGYNNNIMQTLPNNFIDNNKLYYHTNNPINGNNWVCNNNINGNGNNKMSLNPNPWAKYNLNDSYIQQTPQNSQTFAYNRNSSFIDGSIRRQWGGYQTVNISDNNLEQVQTREGIIPNERTQEETDAVSELLDEMDENAYSDTSRYEDNYENEYEDRPRYDRDRV